jgi:GxxExxY protein
VVKYPPAIKHLTKIRSYTLSQLILKEEVFNIVGAAMEVYWQLGRGFLEPVYQEALQIELSRRKIPFVPQQELTICYKGQPLKKMYVADLICYKQIVVELKVLDRLSERERWHR